MPLLIYFLFFWISGISLCLPFSFVYLHIEVSFLSGSDRPCSFRSGPGRPLERWPLGGANHHFCTDCSQTLSRAGPLTWGRGHPVSLECSADTSAEHIQAAFIPTPMALIGLALLSNCPSHGYMDLRSHFWSETPRPVGRQVLQMSHLQHLLRQ